MDITEMETVFNSSKLHSKRDFNVMDRFIETNGIRLHILDHDGPGETLIMMHGLTANAHSFGGLIAAGLNRHMRVIAVDLRGRGQSDKPESGYSMADHAADILGLMDALGLEQAIIGGHSFGGLVTIYLGAFHPERVKSMVILDSGLLHPDVRSLIKPSLERLGRILPSQEAYLTAIRASAYYQDGFWDEALEAYYRADLEELSDGTVRARPRPHNMLEAIDNALAEDWPAIIPQAHQPSVLLHAPDGFGPPGTPPVILEEDARETASLLGNCTYHRMSGHHITMMFGPHAEKAAATIAAFVTGA